MIFKGLPNQYVRFHNKIVQRATGKRGIYFDENGRYETDSEFLNNVLKQHFEVENNVPGDNPTDEEIRAMAKEKGIDHYWNAKIENLKEKLKEV